MLMWWIAGGTSGREPSRTLIMLSRFVRLFSLVLLLTFPWADAAPEAPSPEKTDAVDFGPLVEIFAIPGLPDVKGKRWVIVDSGPVNWPIEWEGWLIEEDAQEIHLWEWDGEVRTLRKPAAREKRPILKAEPDGSIIWHDVPGGDGSVAWEVRVENFHAKSQKFLADGLPQDKDDQGIFRSMNRRFGLAGHIVDSARYAYYAHQFGQTAHALDLYAHAQKAYKTYVDSHLGGDQDSPSLPLFVANQLAFGKRNVAIFSGHEGVSRTKLKKQWEEIAAIPHHQYRDEAKSMAKHYQSLLEEDAQWKEPDAKALETFTTEQKVAYWLYHLRDLDAGQTLSPGRCRVLGEFGFELGNWENKPPNPAVELKKLGLAAVPQLIAHLDDARPTRSKGHWRAYWPEGHYLLRYGDCCQQIFESITGHTIFRGTTTVSYPIHDGAEKVCKEKAERWWRESQKKDSNTQKP